MAKKRSILTLFVALLLVSAIMLTLTPLSVSAKTTSSEEQTSKGIVTGNHLNVRANPSTDSDIVGNLKKGTLIDIEEVVKTSAKIYNVWLKIDYNGDIGYVSKNHVDYVKEDDEDKTSTNSESKSYVGVVTATGLNLRDKPTTNSKIITVLKHKSLVNVSEIIHTSDKVNNTWLKVSYNNTVGYVAEQYVESTDNSKQVGITTTELNLRDKPTTTNSKVLEILHKGVCVDILSSRTCSNQKWYEVRSPKGTTGWVSGKYLKVGKLTS